MRFKLFILSNFLAASAVFSADETLPQLKVGSEVFSNVTVTSVSATDIYFIYGSGSKAGVANAKLKNLDPALQQHFHFNRTNAVAMEKKQAQAKLQYHDWVLHQPTAPPQSDRREEEESVATAAPGPELVWRNDVQGALNQARSDKKLVLLNFTGSDWCPWCIKFDHDVLSTQQFAAYSRARLELVKLDFPHNTAQSDSLKRANVELGRHFQIQGFPTYVLLDAAGHELGRQAGYLQGGPDAFIAELNSFSKQ